MLPLLSKNLRSTISVVACLISMWLPGCAMLGLEPSPDESLDMSDPVVRAALSVRSQNSDLRSMNRSPSSIENGRTNREVVPGMDMRDVRAVLGEPLEIETAGQDTSGNQRWVYSDGYRGELNHGPSRVLYFENGKVAGWRNYDSR